MGEGHTPVPTLIATPDKCTYFTSIPQDQNCTIITPVLKFRSNRGIFGTFNKQCIEAHTLVISWSPVDNLSNLSFHSNGRQNHMSWTFCRGKNSYRLNGKFAAWEFIVVFSGKMIHLAFPRPHYLVSLASES